MEKIFIIDGYGFLFRAYHSMPPLTSPESVPVGAVYGFVKLLMKLRKDLNVKKAIIVFDSGSKNFRHEIYDQYKANRPPAPEDLLPQFAIIREAATAMGFKFTDKKGFEADDLIATIAKQAEKENREAVIVSSDKDLMQLINDHISMFDPMKIKEIKAQQVFDKFSVRPDQILDYLSLVGDSSDNIPGVPSIGAKTAAELLGKFDSIEGIYENLDQITQKRRYETLKNNHNLAKLSQKLVALNSEIKLDFELDDLNVVESESFSDFASKYGFKSLVKPTMNSEKQPKSNELEAVRINNVVELENALKNSSLSRRIILNILDDPKRPDNLVVSFGFNAQKFFYCVISQDLNLFDSSEGVSLEEFVNLIGEILQNESILKITHNAKKLFNVFDKFNAFDDVMLMSYVIDNGLHEHSLESISQHLFEHLEIRNLDELLGSGKNRINFSELETNALEEFILSKMNILSNAHNILTQAITENKLKNIYEKFDKPLTEVLFDMEKEGVLVDANLLTKLSSEFRNILLDLEKKIYLAAGKEFNIASPKQLSHVLFEEMSLPHPKKKGNSTPSTNVEILEDLALKGHLVAEHLINWRQISKLLSTYSDALVKQIDSKTARVHTKFNASATSTGRLSSTDPNLQNIPIRSKEGQKIRKAFIAKKSYKLISADYSQIELRILASIAKITPLIEAFKNEQDIHSLTASQVFSVDIKDVDSNLRRQAKAINFGIIYGISAFGLAKQISISNSEAKEYIQKYFAKYPGIEKYMDDIKKFAAENGFVKTLFGRKCHLKSINSKNFMQKNFAERAAINAPIQGTAADIIKKSMIMLHRNLSENYPNAKILLQIHDELLIEAPESQAEEIVKVTQNIMQNAVMLDVPLTVDIEIGNNWHEIH